MNAKIQKSFLDKLEKDEPRTSSPIKDQKPGCRTTVNLPKEYGKDKLFVRQLNKNGVDGNSKQIEVSIEKSGFMLLIDIAGPISNRLQIVD